MSKEHNAKSLRRMKPSNCGPISSLPTWLELLSLTEKTVSQAVAQSATQAASEVISNIQFEIRNITEHLSALKGRCIALSNKFVSTITSPSDHITMVEEHLTQLSR